MNVQSRLPLIAAMAENLAPYRDDEETYLDTLDGETDALDLLDREIAAVQADEALSEAIKSREADLKTRRDRIDMRAEAHRKNLRLILNAMGVQKAERALATVSLRPGTLSVRILDEAEIPSQLMREKVTRTPDKAAIKAQIEAGETVPGAELARGDETIMVKVR